MPHTSFPYSSAAHPCQPSDHDSEQSALLLVGVAACPFPLAYAPATLPGTHEQPDDSGHLESTLPRVFSVQLRNCHTHIFPNDGTFCSGSASHYDPPHDTSIVSIAFARIQPLYIQPKPGPGADSPLCTNPFATRDEFAAYMQIEAAVQPRPDAWCAHRRSESSGSAGLLRRRAVVRPPSLGSS